jgi:hypothetical protein
VNDATSKWLSGCGIGCLIVLVLLGAGGVFLYRLAKGTIQEFEDVGRAMSDLRTEYGEVRDFTPPLSGEIPAERLEAFLEVRAATRPARDEIRELLGTLESEIAGFDGGGEGSVRKVLSAVRRGVGTIPKLAKFHQTRADALLERGMGLGEYEYIYVLAFYSWLGKSPGDGPKFLRMGDHNDVSWNPDHHPEDAEEQRRVQVTRRIRSNFQAFFRNALSAADSDEPRANREWLAAVERELIELESRWDRIPWRDGMPTVTEDSLRAFGERIEDSYDELNNVLEMIAPGGP